MVEMRLLLFVGALVTGYIFQLVFIQPLVGLLHFLTFFTSISI